MDSSSCNECNGRRIDRFGNEEGLPSSVISALVVGDARDLWVGTLHGLARRAGATFVALASESGLPKAWVRLFQPHPPRFLPLAVFSALDGLGKLARVTSNMRVVAIREGNPPC